MGALRIHRGLCLRLMCIKSFAVRISNPTFLCTFSTARSMHPSHFWIYIFILLVISSLPGCPLCLLNHPKGPVVWIISLYGRCLDMLLLSWPNKSPLCYSYPYLGITSCGGGWCFICCHPWLFLVACILCVTPINWWCHPFGVGCLWWTWVVSIVDWRMPTFNIFMAPLWY